MRLNKNSKDITGQKFGRLIVLEPVFVKNETIYWKCLCDCGIFAAVGGSSLRRNNRGTKSCGCLQKEKAAILHKFTNNTKLSLDQLYLSTVKHHFKNNALGRGKIFELSDELILKLSKSNCFYCDGDPSNFITVNRSHCKTITYQGIDRIDSSVGYLEKNVVPCCKTCNMAKSILGQKEFYRWVIRIFNNLNSSNKLNILNDCGIDFSNIWN